ncbi:hypothetical protein AOXY_G29742 [Acipenser oxyrinchus oxyrinchus]|uniref:Uncharacterized protein n=1 Tax=Acipenser oxyrinchus oxyrinchus TaxID=40147 RepID=A0AAD8CQ41_ACIOX|nr:hypothetical protein AOXY_G29742 [Acipenser oxyrinchus oxyrinchus]
MSKLLSVLLVIVVLAAVCSDHTVECVKRIRTQQWPPRNNECSCEVLPNKQLSCRKTFPPRSNQEKMKMMECLCKKHRHELHKKLRQDLQNMCKRIININPPIPIPLAR